MEEKVRMTNAEIDGEAMGLKDEFCRGWDCGVRLKWQSHLPPLEPNLHELWSLDSVHKSAVTIVAFQVPTV
jgi:hypothetical protein